MSICSYVVLPQAGCGARVAECLAALPGCEVARAENREVLLLVTETAGADQEAALRRSLEGLTGVHALMLAFGDIDAG